MEDMQDTESTSLDPSEENLGEELSHTDKMAGIFTEPSNTYEQTAKFPPRTKDWLLPMLFLFILLAVTQLILFNNEEVYFNTKQETLSKTEKKLNERVESGEITREKADQQYQMTEQQFEMGRKPIGIVIRSVAVFIFGFIFFFVVTAIQYFFIKFMLKGEGNYSSALVASGLTAYIVMIQVILGLILAILMGRMLQDTSAASLLNSDKSTILGFILAKIDPITIWAYIISAIGLAKMFHSADTKKYYLLVFGLWIFGSLLWFGLGKIFPFLQFGM